MAGPSCRVLCVWIPALLRLFCRLRLWLLGEELIDLGLEGGVRLRPRKTGDGLHLRAGRVGVCQEEQGRAAHPGLCAVSHVFSYCLGVLSCAEASLELGYVQTDRLGVRFRRFQARLVRE